MDSTGGLRQPGATPPLPRSIWVVAWASLAGQVLVLLEHGGRLDDEVSVALSVVLGALVVGYVSAGVVRARTVRLALAWIVLGLIGVLELLGLVLGDLEPTAYNALSLATTVAALAGLASFRRTEWYAWQRTKPSGGEGAPIGKLVLVGVVVGILGGLTGAVDDGVEMRVGVADR